MLSRRFFLKSSVPVLGLAVAASINIPWAFAVEGGTPEITVYKSPDCGCCGKWVDHLRANGFSVRVENRYDLSAVKEAEGVPPDLQSCHTAVAGRYVIEGHVPAADIKRLLAAEPAARGLAVPGMPAGSPGMEAGAYTEPYDVFLFGKAGRIVFASH